MKVAKIIWISVGTRVIVEDTATNAEIWEAAKQRLIDNVTMGALENIEEIVLDNECPYGTLDTDTDKDSK